MGRRAGGAAPGRAGCRRPDAHGRPHPRRGRLDMRVSVVIPRDPPGVNNYHQVPIGGLYTAAELRAAGTEVSFHDLRVDAGDLDARYQEISRSDLAIVMTTDYDLA